MIIETVRTVRVSLQLSLEEAMWLKDVVQNFPGGVGFEDEKSKTMREDLFTGLDKALKTTAPVIITNNVGNLK